MEPQINMSNTSIASHHARRLLHMLSLTKHIIRRLPGHQAYNFYTLSEWPLKTNNKNSWGERGRLTCIHNRRKTTSTEPNNKPREYQIAKYQISSAATWTTTHSLHLFFTWAWERNMLRSWPPPLLSLPSLAMLHCTAPLLYSKVKVARGSYMCVKYAPYYVRELG